ncbi:MAG: elongation factor 4 [Candidatus Sungbacteria bacterium RIFCSPHIGHO2_02_FULL_41_12b]|nr:MAG: elongation factor 4 [Candidatus Sungbacteria bacterium RIFCSPHIGHO2_02_FULL_41_12b]
MNIRNFVIIAHIDHGKSTLADRFLELTGTIEKRKMREQFLDTMELEREKGITIKMQPVRMLWHPHRGKNADYTQNNAESTLLYEDLTYKIRGVLFQVRKKIGLGHKEQVYHNALEIEFKNAGLLYESKKNIPILYEGRNIGTYQPDFVVENKVLIELKALPEIGRPQVEQTWSYPKGCEYKVALLVNYGSTDLEIKRIVYDTARNVSALSALSQHISAGVSDQIENDEYILNLIDTPGHVDFTYEVSRALACVEGAILLVDATQGVQAQTIANLHLAKQAGLAIIPAINKIDLAGARIKETEDELVNLLGVKLEDIFKVSGKTGEGVEELLRAVIERIPPPEKLLHSAIGVLQSRALIFDSHFDNFRGVIAHVRVFDGEFKKQDKILMAVAKSKADIMELGFFMPELLPQEKLSTGEIGYIATGIKEPEGVRIGDTVILARDAENKVEIFFGYRQPKPMVFASVYPEDADDYEKLRDSLKKIKLNDASLFFEPEASDALGRGFRAGFLGMLHMEIIGERLKREYGLSLVFTTPSVAYLVAVKDGKESYVYSPSLMPEEHEITSLKEPWVKLEIITPQKFLGGVMGLLRLTRGSYVSQEYFGSGRLLIVYGAPLKDILVDFFDKLKSVTEGYGSLGYELLDYRVSDLSRLDILVAGEPERAFSQMVPKEDVYNEGRSMVQKLKEILPKQLFTVSLQAAVSGKIIARETIPAMKKDVTGYLYGGDRTRKMKLWKKQKRGKERLKAGGRVEIPPDVFLKMLKR